VGDIGAAAGPFLIGGIAQIGGVAVACGASGGLGIVAVMVLWRFVPETLRRNVDG
jgi:hypothetical protein